MGLRKAWCLLYFEGCNPIELNRFRLSAFGSAVVAGKCLATGSPPNELLQSWVGPQGSLITKLSRTRSGPIRGSLDASPAPTDTTSLLLTAVVPAVTMMAYNMSETMKKSSKRARSPLPPSSPLGPCSSPPPAVENELKVFLTSFAAAKGISSATIQDIFERLQDAQYDPDAISEMTLSNKHLQEITGLAEGQVYSLRKYARQWCGKIEAKRAKRKHWSELA